MKKIPGTVKASAASVKISCVTCFVVFLEKMERALSIWLMDDILERALSIWLMDDILERAVSGALVREKGSFHSSQGWLEKLEEWMNMHNMNMIELPSADCETK
jgi:hypothetical protein